MHLCVSGEQTFYNREALLFFRGFGLFPRSLAPGALDQAGQLCSNVLPSQMIAFGYNLPGPRT